ncbi:hypothetical protein K501DRAFT_299570 [Backusella circina FSU 941]|nr:hypothetical protein K501DRAFT_299570 [Backusella circina FSU 941]
MTTGASYNGFSPQLTWIFLIPVATAGAICLAVNYALWPDDSINNFLAIFQRTLGNYNAFFKEHSDTFLDPSLTPIDTTLPSVNNRLQDGCLLLIDSKRAVHSEILYSRISDKDCSRLTDAIKNMRINLHGIGLSTIMKGNYMNDQENTYFEHFQEQNTIDAFTSALNGIRPAASSLADLCYKATSEGATRVAAMHYHPRTALNSILWPFPRLWISGSKVAPEEVSTVSSRDVKLALDRFEQCSTSNEIFSKFLCMNAADIPRNGPLYLLFLYIHNLKEHAARIVALVELVEGMEERRTHYRLWFPHQTLKKWLRSDEINTGTGSDLNNYENQMGAELARMATRPDNSDDRPAQEIFDVKKTPSQKKKARGDPDVTGPQSSVQWFFYGIYRAIQWITDPTIFFALKTGVGVVMLAIPAWRVQDAGWYNQWRGQWAMITLVLWMFPATGFFIFGLIDRVIGSVVGAVLGIVVWEITRGNPYGIAVVCFVLFLPAYYVFFFRAKYRVIALMGKITMLLCLIYEHNYATSGVEEYDQIYTVAGKRLLMVMLGLAASWILVCFPFPQTSRVELRKSLARTIQDIGKAFGILSANTISDLGTASPEQTKGFHQLAIELRRQVSLEYTFLHNSAYEPPLRGNFPAQSYKLLLEKVDNMADLVIGMVIFFLFLFCVNE